MTQKITLENGTIDLGTLGTLQVVLGGQPTTTDLQAARTAIPHYGHLYWLSMATAPVDPGCCLHNVVKRFGHGHWQCTARVTVTINGVGFCRTHAKAVISDLQWRHNYQQRQAAAR